MAKGDFQISLVKVSSQYILLDPRSFEQVVCAERDGMENPSARGILGWLQLEKLCLGPKPGVPALASAHVRHGGREEGQGVKHWEMKKRGKASVWKELEDISR